MLARKRPVHCQPVPELLEPRSYGFSHAEKLVCLAQQPHPRAGFEVANAITFAAAHSPGTG